MKYGYRKFSDAVFTHSNIAIWSIKLVAAATVNQTAFHLKTLKSPMTGYKSNNRNVKIKLDIYTYP